MKIGEAAAMNGVTVKAIRHYEARGLLDPLPRRGKYRRFSPSDIERLKLIAHCRGLGLGIVEIKRVVSLVVASRPECPPPDAMIELIDAKLRGVRSKIRELQRTATQLAMTQN
jgi:DNA-binding transcriptional MerR regulator